MVPTPAQADDLPLNSPTNDALLSPLSASSYDAKSDGVLSEKHASFASSSLEMEKGNPNETSLTIHIHEPPVIARVEPAPQQVESPTSIKLRRWQETTRTTVMAFNHWIHKFKHFVCQGRVVELAVGLVIGAAFTTVITSLVNDIFSPIIGLAIGTQLENAFVYLKAPDSAICQRNATVCAFIQTPAQAHAAGAVTWNYGNFMQTLINFFMVALILFLLVRAITIVRRTHRLIMDRVMHVTDGDKRGSATKRDSRGAAAGDMGRKSKKLKKKVRECVFCFNDVDVRASRCGSCTSRILPLEFSDGDVTVRELPLDGDISGLNNDAATSSQNFLIQLP